MKVTYRPNELMIEPETDFERTILDSFRETTSFLKCGLSSADIIGYVIRIIKPEKEYLCPYCSSNKVYKLLNTLEKDFLCGDCTKSWKG
jgi:transposase-like protein